MSPRRSLSPIEHTADAGFKIKAPTLRQLFVTAAESFYGLITDVQALRGNKPETTAYHRLFKLEAVNSGELLLAWLRELLYDFSVKRRIFLRFKIKKLTETELKVEASGIRFDPKKHEQRYEVKAVTYHGFKLGKTRMGWTSEIIFDI